MDNKKTYVMIGAGLLFILGMLFFLSPAKEKVLKTKKEEKNSVTEDEKQFKKEYEKLNEVKIEGSNKTYVKMHLPETNKMVYATEKEILEVLEKGTGIIYFGFPECPWCRNALPVLVDAALSEDISKIYYYNAREDRDEKVLEDGKVVTKKEGTSFYQKVLEKLGNAASIYEGLEDDSIKRLYFPSVVFVKEGKVLSLHESTLDAQEDPYTELTKSQKEALKEIYIKGITSVYGTVCDEKC